MNIKNYIKEKWNEKKKKCNKYKNKYLFAYSIYFSVINAIIFLATYISGENNFFSINTFLFIELFTFLMTLIFDYIDKIIEHNSEKKQDYYKLISNYKQALSGMITTKEEIDIKNLCKNSTLTSEEIEMIRRNILIEEKSETYKIDTEYLMFKFLIEIENNEGLKKKFNSYSQKIKGQMATLNEKIKTLKSM